MENENSISKGYVMEAIFSLIVFMIVIFGVYVLFHALALFIKHPISFILMLIGLGFLFGEDDCEI